VDSIYGIEREPSFLAYRDIGNVIEDKIFIQGPQVRQLEETLAKYVGRKYGVGVNSGTDAEFLLLKALGIGKGDLVFVPDFTFLSTATAVKMTGARPIFVDVDLATFNMQPLSLNNKIKATAGIGVPKAVVPVDLFGVPYDYKEINKIAHRYGMVVIEDGCHAMGSKAGKKKALGLGDFSFTSFYPTKPLGCFGDGGMIFCDDYELAYKLQLMRKHGQGIKHHCYELGYNSRLDTIQAAVLLAKFDTYEKGLGRRREIAQKYINELPDAHIQRKNYWQDFSDLNHALFSVLCNSNEQRGEAQKRLRAASIPFSVYYPQPLHELEVFREDLVSWDYANASALSKKILQIPMHPYLKDGEVEKIIEAVKEGFR
jgi:dTDP-4-amino-4,6-dideoxygalactose transaminase